MIKETLFKRDYHKGGLTVGGEIALNSENTKDKRRLQYGQVIQDGSSLAVCNPLLDQALLHSNDYPNPLNYRVSAYVLVPCPRC